MSISETVIDGRELFLIIKCGKTFARSVLKYFRIVIAVATKVKVADVVLDLAGGLNVFIREENLASAQATLNRLFVTSQHRKRDQLTDLRRSGSVNLTDAEKAPFGLFECSNRRLHFSVDEGAETGGPCSQCFYFLIGANCRK